MMAMAGPLEFIWFNQVAADIIRLGWAMGMSDWKTWSGVGETTLQKPKESIETSHPRYDDRSQQCLQMSNWVSVYCTVYTVGQILLAQISLKKNKCQQLLFGDYSKTFLALPLCRRLHTPTAIPTPLGRKSLSQLWSKWTVVHWSHTGIMIIQFQFRGLVVVPQLGGLTVQ